MTGLPWVRIDSTLPTNPKISALIDEEPQGRAAVAQYVLGICYSGGNTTNGYIGARTLPLFHGTKRLAQLLIDYGLWEKDDATGGWWIHDYADYQLTRREERARNARSLAMRRRNCRRWHGPDCKREECAELWR